MYVYRCSYCNDVDQWPTASPFLYTAFVKVTIGRLPHFQQISVVYLRHSHFLQLQHQMSQHRDARRTGGALNLTFSTKGYTKEVLCKGQVIFNNGMDDRQSMSGIHAILPIAINRCLLGHLLCCTFNIFKQGSQRYAALSCDRRRHTVISHHTSLEARSRSSCRVRAHESLSGNAFVTSHIEPGELYRITP